MGVPQRPREGGGCGSCDLHTDETVCVLTSATRKALRDGREVPPAAAAGASACRMLGARGHFRPPDAQVTGLLVSRADGHTGQVGPALKCPEGTLNAPVISDRLCKSILHFFQVCYKLFSSVQLLSHVQLFATPWRGSMPGFPVRRQLLKLAETHVHPVGDVIQPSHLLSFPSPPTFSLSQHQGLFQ